MGLSLDQVRTTISNANAVAPLGAIDGDRQLIAMETNSQLKTLDEYRNLVVKTVDGKVVRLSHIASVEQGTRNSRSAAMFNRQPAVLLTVIKSADANVLDTVDRIKELIPEIKRWVPADQALGTGRCRHHHSVRSDDDTARQRTRHAIHAGLVDCARDGRRLRISTTAHTDHRCWNYRPTVACRHVRGDVVRGLLCQQLDADGARGLGRLRR
jgi:hypothetical protein